MDRNKQVILESIFLYISLGLNWGALQFDRTLPLWMCIILSIGWFFIFIKINEIYAKKDIKVFGRIKLTYFGTMMGLIAYIVLLLQFY